MIATEPTSGDEVGFARTDASGHFVLSSPIAQVDLSATTNNEWAFLLKIDGRTSSPALKLSRECTPFHGRITLDDLPPWPRIEVLRIGGFDVSLRGVFGIAVNSDYHFEACLPAAKYYITFAPTFVDQTILTVIPTSEPLVVRSASKRAAIGLPTAPLDIPAQTRTAFLDDIPITTRVLGLGESNHGSNEFNKERTELSIAWARRHKFTLLLIEAGYGEILALDDYIKGADISLDEAISNIDYWLWCTTAFRDSMIALREYNRTAPANHRITLRGIDIQPTFGVIGDLLSSGIQMTEHDARLLLRLREHQGAKWPEFSSDERKSIRGVLQLIAESRDLQGLNSVKNRHALSARSLMLALDLLEHQEYWDQRRIRDKAMAQLSTELLDLEPSARAIVCAHLIHLAREYVAGAPTLGGYLAASFGRGYQVYALLARDGVVRARGANEQLGVIPHPLPKAPPYTLENVLLPEKSAITDEITYWNFDHASAIGKRWMRGLHYLRLVGVYYPADNFPFQVFDLTTFDGAILFRNVTPIEPIGEAASSKTGSKPN